MKKLIGIVLACISISMQAQYVRPAENGNASQPSSPLISPPPSFADNLSIGGSVSLQFGDYTYIELEPLLSYHFNQNFMIGIGPIYQYESVNAQVYGYGYSSSIYGGRIAAMYFLPDELSRLFIMGEFDVLNLPEASYYTYQISRANLELPMLGIGYKEPVSDKAFFCIYGLWDFNNSPYSPYVNPLINVGFDIGLGR